MAEFCFQGFGFGDFKFASPPQPQPFNPSNHINGTITSNVLEEEDEWGDFIAISQSTPPNPLQFNFSNGFSHPQTSINPPQTSNTFDPFGILKNDSAQPAPSTDTHVDSNSNKFQKPKGPLPLSLFGEEEEAESESDSKLSVVDNSNNLSGFKQAETVRNGINLDLGVGVSDVIARLYNQDQQINSGNGLSLTFNGSDSNTRLDPGVDGEDEGVDDEDDWQFNGSLPENGGGERISKEQGVSEISGSKVGVIMGQQTQDISSVVENMRGFTHSSHEFGDLFAVSNVVLLKSSEMVFGSTFEPTSIIPNGFPSVPYGVQEVGNRNGIATSSRSDNDDFDEFGDFMGAPSKTGSYQEEQMVASRNTAEMHLSNGKIQDQKAAPKDTTEMHLPNGIDENNRTKPENHRSALPLSLFSDGIVDSDDHHQNALIYKPASSTTNGISTHSSAIPIHDLISTLYSQASHSFSLDSNKKSIENGLHSPKMTDSHSVNGDDDFDDGSWEFKDAFSETTVNEQTGSPYPGVVAQNSSAKQSDLQVYVNFYAKLRFQLGLLVSSLLDDLKKSQSSDTVTGKDGMTVALEDEVQEAYKVLQDNMASTEVYLDNQFARKGCINEVCEVLHGPEFQVLELEYHLSGRLQLAEKDWRPAIKLLKHAKSMLKILTLGSVREQSAYVSTWSRILSVCAQELRHGASIWKRALDRNVHSQIFHDLRGQSYFQALGEIYRVVELLRTSAKLYKPWILFTVADPTSIFPLLDECSTLWSGSGLEEALRTLSNMVDFGSGESASRLLESIKYVHDIDVSSMHDIDLIRQRPFCQLSLLPEEIVPGLKLVLWNGEHHFLQLANLWANLISCEPPQLPPLQVS
ncbi:hypothetical protein Ancab_000755 [Ancistrocladus abbreviatus]